MFKIIKFEKDGCIPCENVSKYLESKGLDYEKINAFDKPEMSVKFRIRSVPTLILLKNDDEIERVIGYDELKIDELISKMS